MPNTFTPSGIEPGPFGTLTDDTNHLAIQPPLRWARGWMAQWLTSSGSKREDAGLNPGGPKVMGRNKICKCSPLLVYPMLKYAPVSVFGS